MLSRAQVPTRGLRITRTGPLPLLSSQYSEERSVLLGMDPEADPPPDRVRETPGFACLRPPSEFEFANRRPLFWRRFIAAAAAATTTRRYQSATSSARSLTQTRGCRRPPPAPDPDSQQPVRCRPSVPRTAGRSDPQTLPGAIRPADTRSRLPLRSDRLQDGESSRRVHARTGASNPLRHT